jgi:signal transduction histidine kinase
MKIQNWTWWLIPLLLLLLLFPSIVILNREFLGAARRMDNLIDGYERNNSIWIQTQVILESAEKDNVALQAELIENIESLINWLGSDELRRMRQFTQISEPVDYLLIQLSRLKDVYQLSPHSIQVAQLFPVDENLHSVRDVLGDYRKRLDGGFSFLVQAQVLLILLLMILIVIALEDRARQRLDNEATLRIQVETARAQEEERNRIALDLHDDIAQELSWMRLKMARSDTDPAQINMIDSMIRKIRGMSQNLRTPNFRTEFFDDAVRDLIIAAEQRSHLSIKYLPGHKHPENQPEVYGQMYRIIQECLNNARKHAGECRVFIEVQEEAEVVYLEYRDDGLGSDPANLEGHDRLGLKGIRNRIRIMGGKMNIATSPGRGLTLSCSLPFKGAPGG